VFYCRKFGLSNFTDRNAAVLHPTQHSRMYKMFPNSLPGCALKGSDGTLVLIQVGCVSQIQHSVPHHFTWGRKQIQFSKRRSLEPSLNQWQTKTPCLKAASELYRPSDRRLSAKLVPDLLMEGATWSMWRIPYGRILGFLDWSRHFFLHSTRSSSIVLTRLSGPRFRPITSQKIW
jgi:hypothetical protein